MPLMSGSMLLSRGNSDAVLPGLATLPAPPGHISHEPILLLMVLVDGASITAATRIILVAVLVADLASGLSTAILPALGKALVEIGADDAFVELCAANVLHAVEGVLVGVVLDEAEAAGSLLEAVEAHDEALNLAAF